MRTTSVPLKGTSWVNIKIGNHDQCSPHFYTIEMHWWVETLHKVPTRHGHRSYPLISIHYSKSSDWAGHRCVSPSTLIVWRSTKVTLIDSDHCHSVAQHYRTTNYSLPIIPFYTARTFHSWWLRSPSNLANYSLYSIETLWTSAKLILHSSINTISILLKVGDMMSMKLFKLFGDHSISTIESLIELFVIFKFYKNWFYTTDQNFKIL
jgi:hypothetical protein